MGGMLLVNQDPEWLLGQIPMDPVFSLGLLTMACAGLGWLAGPSLGSALFHLFRRGVKQPMAVKEAEFFARIRKNRVAPTTSSVQNPGTPIPFPPPHRTENTILDVSHVDDAYYC